MEEFGFYPRCKKCEAIEVLRAGKRGSVCILIRWPWLLFMPPGLWACKLSCEMWCFLWDMAVGDSEGSIEPQRRGLQLWLDLSLGMPHPCWPLLSTLSGSLVLKRTASETTFITRSFIGWGVLLVWNPELLFRLKSRLLLSSFKPNLIFVFCIVKKKSHALCRKFGK